MKCSNLKHALVSLKTHTWCSKPFLMECKHEHLNISIVPGIKDLNCGLVISLI